MSNTGTDDDEIKLCEFCMYVITDDDPEPMSCGVWIADTSIRKTRYWHSPGSDCPKWTEGSDYQKMRDGEISE